VQQPPIISFHLSSCLVRGQHSGYITESMFLLPDLAFFCFTSKSFTSVVNNWMLFYKFTTSKQDINSIKFMGLDIYNNEVSYMSSVFWGLFIGSWWRSQYSNWLWAGRPRGRSSSPCRAKDFLFSTSARPALGPTQPPIQWVLSFSWTNWQKPIRIVSVPNEIRRQYLANRTLDCWH
jgi:hypothetical protein